MPESLKMAGNEREAGAATPETVIMSPAGMIIQDCEDIKLVIQNYLADEFIMKL